MFKAHPVLNPQIFLGDSAFDSMDLYKQLLTGDTFGTDIHFQKAYIPLNSRSGLTNPDYTINADGIPCCPKDSTLPMVHDGKSKRKNGLIRYKFQCPKTKWVKGIDGKQHRVCKCDNPCTSSPSGRMVHIYPEQNLRAYPGTLRGTQEWDDTYKTRTTVE